MSCVAHTYEYEGGGNGRHSFRTAAGFSAKGVRGSRAFIFTDFDSAPSAAAVRNFQLRMEARQIPSSEPARASRRIRLSVHAPRERKKR
ncbi:hypothetical protein ACLOJK_005347 [Asimina triloba]